ILFGHRLIDNDHARRIFCVALVERTAANQRHFERLKIIAGDHFKIAVQHIRRLWARVLFAPKASLPAAHKRPVRTDRRVLHTGNGAHFIEKCFAECVDLFAIVVDTPGQLETCGEKSARLVTQRERLQPRKTFENQACGDQQSEGECNFANHQPIPSTFGRWRIANSLARAAPRAANRLARFAQAINRTRPTAPSSSPRFVRYLPTRSSSNGVTTAVSPRFVSGYVFSRRAAIPFISVRARSTVTRGLSLPQ